ncbi:MAG: alpha/beta hydrolase [Saprospiraceae bacterium]|nr:alpha/beta hydrolase [Saprospiraceae bacterium]
MQLQLSKTISLIGFMFLFVFMGSCQSNKTLKRSSYLGARLVALEAVEEELPTDSGVFLSDILPGASFGNMGIPAGVVLQDINDEKILSIRDIGRVLDGIKEGDALKAGVVENGKYKTYSGKAVGRPLEDHPNATIEYGTVEYKGNALRSFTYLPKGVTNPPCVFFIQGYTCQSIEMRNDNPAKQLIDEWIKKGYAVFLVEKPGMGDSESEIPCMEIDFNQELTAFSEAYKTLTQNSKIDTDNIFIFGHSMGGVIGPILAKKYPVAGVMVYGIVGKNWYDYMNDIYTEQPLLYGASEEELKDNKTYYLPFVKDMLVHKKSNTELINNPIYGERLKADGVAENLAQGYYINRHYRYWQTLTDVDVPSTWAEVKAPVLVLHGEYDIQAIHHKYGEMIVTNVKAHGGDATFELIPKSEHAFLKFNSREELNTVMGNGTYVQYFPTHFNMEIAKKSMDWMKQNIN